MVFLNVAQQVQNEIEYASLLHYSQPINTFKQSTHIFYNWHFNCKQNELILYSIFYSIVLQQFHIAFLSFAQNIEMFQQGKTTVYQELKGQKGEKCYDDMAYTVLFRRVLSKTTLVLNSTSSCFSHIPISCQLITSNL